MRRAAVLLFILPLSCASSPADTGGAPSGDAGVDVAEEWDPFPLDAAPEYADLRSPPECLALTDAGPGYEAGSPVEAWCDAATTNPASCPSTRPTPGDPCTADDIACRFGATATGLELLRCTAGKWTSRAVHCASECTAFDGGVSPVIATCGSAPEIPCAVNDALSDFERAGRTLRELGQCCGGMTENQLRARFTDGCVTSFEVGRGSTPSFLDCMTRLLAGRRLSCAPTTCAEAEWSTLK